MSEVRKGSGTNKHDNHWQNRSSLSLVSDRSIQQEGYGRMLFRGKEG